MVVNICWWLPTLEISKEEFLYTKNNSLDSTLGEGFLLMAVMDNAVLGRIDCSTLMYFYSVGIPEQTWSTVLIIGKGWSVPPKIL